MPGRSRARKERRRLNISLMISLRRDFCRMGCSFQGMFNSTSPNSSSLATTSEAPQPSAPPQKIKELRCAYPWTHGSSHTKMSHFHPSKLLQS